MAESTVKAVKVSISSGGGIPSFQRGVNNIPHILRNSGQLNLEKIPENPAVNIALDRGDPIDPEGLRLDPLEIPELLFIHRDLAAEPLGLKIDLLLPVAALLAAAGAEDIAIGAVVENDAVGFRQPLRRDVIAFRFQ